MTDSLTDIRAAWAVRLQMFLGGALFATFGVHVPSIKQHYGVGEQALGFAMLAAGCGSLLALLAAGAVIGRFGPRRVARTAGSVYALCIASLLATPHYALLLAAMGLLGIAVSLFDVSINAEASEIERRAARPMMSGFHALFSLGGMVGAAAGSAWLQAGGAPLPHVVGAGLLGVAAALLGGAWMLPAVPAEAGAGLSLPRGRLKWLGALAALGLFTEGAMYDWSVLYVAQEQGAPAGIAALAYAAFSAAMAAARFGGDWVRARWSPRRVLQASGALAALGVALVVATPWPGVALFGFALAGLGLANVVPVLFSAASRVPGVAPAHGIAAVSALGYLGLTAGPPLVGFVAERSSLGWGLGLVLGVGLVLAATARRAVP